MVFPGVQKLMAQKARPGPFRRGHVQATTGDHWWLLTGVCLAGALQVAGEPVLAAQLLQSPQQQYHPGCAGRDPEDTVKLSSLCILQLGVTMHELQPAPGDLLHLRWLQVPCADDIILPRIVAAPNLLVLSAHQQQVGGFMSLACESSTQNVSAVWNHMSSTLPLSCFEFYLEGNRLRMLVKACCNSLFKRPWLL